MANYQPGELDQLVEIQEKVKVPDGSGGNSFTWNTLDSLWCKVRDLSGSERVDYDRVQGEAQYIFVFRNPNVIEDNHRIVWDGVFYNVRYRRRPTQRNLYIEIEAQRGVPQ